MSHLQEKLSAGATVLVMLAAGLLSCTSTDENGEALIVGPDVVALGGAYQFFGTIDSDLTTDCGTATSGTASEDTSTTTSTTSSSDSSDSVYAVDTYIQFENGETLLIKFEYEQSEETFRLQPTTTSTSTCPTTDFVNCNGTVGVNPTCETVDNVTCGGANAFIFASRVPSVSFQASSGIVDWSNGLRLNSSQNGVAFASLEFEMVSTSGSVFTGNVTCLEN